MVWIDLLAARERTRRRPGTFGDAVFWGYFLQILLGIGAGALLLFVRLRERMSLDLAGPALALLATVSAFRIWRHAMEASSAAGDGAWRSGQAARALRGAAGWLGLAFILAGVFLITRGESARGPYAFFRASAYESALAAAAALIGVWRWNIYRRWLQE